MKLQAYLAFFTQLRSFVYKLFSKPWTTRPGSKHSEEGWEKTGRRGGDGFNPTA
jgi:hypothetical protein